MDLPGQEKDAGATVRAGGIMVCTVWRLWSSAYVRASDMAPSVEGGRKRWAVETLVGVVRRSAGKSCLGIDG